MSQAKLGLDGGFFIALAQPAVQESQSKAIRLWLFTEVNILNLLNDGLGNHINDMSQVKTFINLNTSTFLPVAFHCLPAYC